MMFEEPAPICDSFTSIEERGIWARIGFKILDQPILAGGIVEIEFILKNLGNTPIYFLSGGSSSKQRPAYFSFSGFLEKRSNQLIDPMYEVVECGGPTVVMKLVHGKTHSQKLILNQFLDLENLFKWMNNAERDILDIECQHLLAISNSENKVLPKTAHFKDMKFNLRIPVVRDEKRLIQQIQHIYSIVQTNWNPGSSSQQELALQQLCSIRVPLVGTYLEKLIGHPNISFNSQIQKAFSMLKK